MTYGNFPIPAQNQLIESATKRCIRCGLEKSHQEFCRHKKSKDGLSGYCKICNSEVKKLWRKNNPELARRLRRRSFEKHRDKRNESRRQQRQKLRNEVISYYGGKCKCCGETTNEFLTIDHINGGGAEYRRRDSSHSHIYHWLKQNNFPAEGFRILCYNCNCCLGHYGYCPHQIIHPVA